LRQQNGYFPGRTVSSHGSVRRFRTCRRRRGSAARRSFRYRWRSLLLRLTPCIRHDVFAQQVAPEKPTRHRGHRDGRPCPAHGSASSHIRGRE
jgi:hypothetical protein